MWMTVIETAERLKLSPKRIYKLIADGRLRKRVQFGRILITEVEIRKFEKLPRSNGRPRKSGK